MKIKIFSVIIVSLVLGLFTNTAANKLNEMNQRFLFKSMTSQLDSENFTKSPKKEIERLLSVPSFSKEMKDFKQKHHRFIIITLIGRVLAQIFIALATTLIIVRIKTNSTNNQGK